jgi:uncharacterized protein (DUF1015 family)
MENQLTADNYNSKERIVPFQGLRYNQKRVEDLAKVICPPYDIITPEQQKDYYNKSQYNAIRVEYVALQAEDAKTDSRYQRAANTLRQWIKDSVLCSEKQEALYVHDHYFDYLGVKRKRRGLVARVKLEPWYQGIFPHENTFPEAKTDRLQLMRACRVSFSPIMALYNDSHKKVGDAMSAAAQYKPVIDLSYSNDRHIVWSITDSEAIKRISDGLSAEPFYIADGHHRYETALIYQNERRESIITDKEKGINKFAAAGCNAYDYVMMTLVEFSDNGLLMSPIHRLIRGIEFADLDTLEKRLSDFFTIESVDLTEQILQELEHDVIKDYAIAVLGLRPKSVMLLKSRQDGTINKLMPKNQSATYNSLSVNLFNNIVLREVLKLAKDSNNISYLADIKEASRQVETGSFQLAFLLHAHGADIIKDISHARERMPYKSTYFHPKLPTGLVMNPLY